MCSVAHREEDKESARSFHSAKFNAKRSARQANYAPGCIINFLSDSCVQYPGGTQPLECISNNAWAMEN